MNFANESQGAPRTTTEETLACASNAVVYSQLIPKGTKKISLTVSGSSAYKVAMNKTEGDLTNYQDKVANEETVVNDIVIMEDMYLNVQAASNSVNAQIRFWL